MEAFVFAGYPSILSQQRGDELKSGVLTAVSPRLRRSLEELNRQLPPNALPFDPAIDLAFEYPDAFLKADGTMVDGRAFDLRGISGSLIWGVLPDPTGALSARPDLRLRLVGVMAEGSPGYYLRGKRWEIIAKPQPDTAA